MILADDIAGTNTRLALFTLREGAADASGNAAIISAANPFTASHRFCGTVIAETRR